MRGRHGFTRRRFLGAGSTILATLRLQQAAWAMGLGNGAGVCALIPEQEMGPFYIANEAMRSDISEGKAGVPLWLRIVVLDAQSCKPLANAAVDVWQCDAMGVYSGFSAQNPMGSGGPGGPAGGFNPRGPGGPGGPGDGRRPGDGNGGPPQNKPTDQLTFLRGVQVTDQDGSVRFRTVFPGFYQGRTNHIHFKVRSGGHDSGKAYEAGHVSHVGQVFFPEELSVKLMQEEPYRRHGIHRTTQEEDMVFGGQRGEQAIARVQAASGDASGFTAELVAGVDTTVTPVPAGR